MSSPLERATRLMAVPRVPPDPVTKIGRDEALAARRRGAAPLRAHARRLKRDGRRHHPGAAEHGG